MSNNIDTLFKKALKDHSSAPPPYVWGNIGKYLSAKQKRKKVLGWWYSCAAGVVLLLSFFFLLQNKEIEQTIITANLVQPFITQNLAEPAQSQPEVLIPPAVSEPTLFAVKLPVAQERITPVNVMPSDESTPLVPASLPIGIKNNTIRKDFIPLINKAAILNHQQYHQLLAVAAPSTTNETEKNKLKISLSGSVTPGYSSGNYNSSVQNSRGRNYTSKEMSGIFNIGGGLKISVATNKRLSVQTGIFYTQMGQRTKESNIYVPKESALINPSTASNNYISSALGTIPYPSGSNALIYKSEGPIMTLSNRNMDGSIEQLFGAIEIPLSVKYRLNDNKIKFSIIGGISNSFIIDNRAYLVYDDKRETLGATENIRNFNISTDLGIGVEYPITSKISFIMEPGFRYYLQSISQDAAINFRPYTFTFSTGVGINF